jgi:hypothetical protein
METYLHLLDASQPISSDCSPLLASAAPVGPRVQPIASTALARFEKQLTLPLPSTKGATITITVNIGD